MTILMTMIRVLSIMIMISTLSKQMIVFMRPVSILSKDNVIFNDKFCV